ncbi:MAG TPA: hypothetical protein VFF15_09275 [Flavobacteriaceae bacterium]|nr:hypothetical protein [Flavobacteriaceae bacterium]
MQTIHTNMQEFLEFLYQIKSFIYMAVEVMAAVTGLLLYRKYKHTPVKYFIYFLVYVVFIDSIGRYSYFVRGDGIFNFLEGTLLERNYWWYNLTWVINATVFFGWYFMKVLKSNLFRRILKISIYCFVIFSVVVILLTLPAVFKSSMPSLAIFSALIILQCVTFYFLEILQSDRVLTFYKSINFYICCAILVLWLVQIPLVFFEQYFSLADMNYAYLKNYISIVAVPYMYITFTVGLLVSKPEYV